MADLERLCGKVTLGRANARDLIALRLSIEIIPRLRQSLADSRSSLLQVLSESLDELEDVSSLIAKAIADIGFQGFVAHEYTPLSDPMPSESPVAADPPERVAPDADGGTDFAFAQDVEALVAAMLPGSKLSAIPADHVLYRSFYIVDWPAGRTRAKEQASGVQDEGRIKILLLPNDLGGALARDEQGVHRWPCTPGGNVQREWALRFSVNVLLYATCTDYKTDRAHVETLLRNREWR